MLIREIKFQNMRTEQKHFFSSLHTVRLEDDVVLSPIPKTLSHDEILLEVKSLCAEESLAYYFNASGLIKLGGIQIASEATLCVDTVEPLTEVVTPGVYLLSKTKALCELVLLDLDDEGDAFISFAITENGQRKEKVQISDEKWGGMDVLGRVKATISPPLDSLIASAFKQSA